MPGHAPGHAPSFVTGYAPGHVTGYVPGYAPGYVTGDENRHNNHCFRTIRGCDRLLLNSGAAP